MAITAKRFETITSQLHDQPRRYPAGDCLYFRCGKARFDKAKNKMVPGAVSFLMRYEVGGKDRWHGIGSASVYTLTEARDVVRRKRRDQRSGKDPITSATSVASAAKVPTFEEAAIARFHLIEAKWTNQRNRDQYLSRLRHHAFPIIGKMSVAEVDTPHIIQLLTPIWTTRRQTADRVRSRIKDILDWATVAGHRKDPSNPTQNLSNPARWDGHLQVLMPHRPMREAKHHAALPYEEIPAFMQQLRARDGVNAACLEFLILTASRAGEAIGARWDEIDFDARTWTVPKGRMKMRREQVVPLSDRAVALLKSLHREEGGFVFIGSRYSKPLGKMVLPDLLGALGYAHVTCHGMRATFRTWAGETTNFPTNVCEAALAHYASGTEGAYMRGKLLVKRNALMSEWAKFAMSKPVRATVLPLRTTTASGA
jgi:integrase